MSDAPERWLSELYRASAREEAPVSLDARILAEARTDLRSRRSRFSNWGAPLAAAAMVVVTASLVIAMRDDTAFTERSTGDSGAPQAPAPSLAPPQTAAPAESVSTQQAMKQRRDESQHKPNGASQTSRDRHAAVGEGRVEAPAAAPAAKAELTERPAAPPSPTSASTPLSAPKARDPAPTQDAPAASLPRALGKLSDSSDPPTRQQRAAESVERDRASTRSKSAAGNEAAQRMEAATESPETWLERIVKLRNEGRIAEAKQSFAAFKERYPDHPLPPALKEW